MANDKYYGFSPKNDEDIQKLNNLNPYEFKKGMDYELNEMGIDRLVESTIEDRKKATETVLKKLEEYNSYYSCLVHYETKYRNVDKKPTFKSWIKEFHEENSMKEVNKTFKNDKMEKLKEAIKAEVKTMLSEVKGKDAEKINKADAKAEKDAEKSASKGAKGKDKALKALEKEVEKLKKDKDKNKDKLSAPLQKYKDGKLTADEYKKLSAELVKANKEINARLSDIEKEKDNITLKEKLGRREVAKTMMEKDTHMEILNIMKEAGVNLREGAGGIKMYYEIAKTAYQEGFMAGLKK